MSSIQVTCDAIVRCIGAKPMEAVVLWGCCEPELREELAIRLGSAVRIMAVAPNEIVAQVLQEGKTSRGSWTEEFAPGGGARLFHELASEGSINRVAVVGTGEANGEAELDGTLLLAAAQAGFFAVSPQFGSAGAAGASASVALLRFERRDYQIRLAGEADIAALEDLERACWPIRLQTSRDRLLARLRTHPEGQLVLVADHRVVAVVYSQRTEIEVDLTGLTMWTAETLHRPQGGQVYLLGIAVRPELQDRNFGGELLEFMLQRSLRQRGLERVVGVTRCKDMARYPQVMPDQYIRLRNEFGGLVDTTLRFHELHGAEIVGLVPGYRPDDDENHGHGVLVKYDLSTRRARTPAPVVGMLSSGSPAGGSLAQFVQNVAEGLLQKTGDRARAFSLSSPLMEMGLDSGDILELRERISHHCGFSIETEFFFTHNTLKKIIVALERRVAEAAAAAALSESVPGTRVRPATAGVRGDDVAIIGLAVRLPGGVDDVEGFWGVLTEEKCVVARALQGRLTWPDDIDCQGTHRGIDYGGFLTDIASFDAGLFRISRKEAELMDPQQRLLLELSWECLQHAGYLPQASDGSRTGVFVGASGSDYAKLLAEAGIETEAHSGLGTSMAIVANRISYLFDFCGPSLLIDTACSSSLVAVHTAVKALRAGECEQALVGGVNIICHASGGVAYYKSRMLSPDGRCKSFDESANGYVRAEGGAMILLKPLARALADGDPIRAVIKGSAVNHGGRANGLTVPHPGKQVALVTDALRDAGVDATRVGYIEAHGSATPLGDPIELSALKQALTELSSPNPSASHRCAVGSVKSNLGHLEAAAGIVGLIKVVLALEHRFIPASLHFKRLNPHISLEDSPLHVAAAPAMWPAPAGEGLRCGGVSSFGSGGTNAHVVLEEAPAHVPIRRSLPRQVFSRQRYWAPDRNPAPRTKPAVAPGTTTLWRRVWRELPAMEQEMPAGGAEERRVVLCDLGAVPAESSSDASPDATVIAFRSDSPQVEDRFCDYAERLLETLRDPMRSAQGRRLLVQVLVPDDQEGVLLTGMAAALKTLREENARVNGQVVVVDGSETVDRLLAKAELASRFPAEAVVRFRGETLSAARWYEVEATDSHEMPWHDEGVYLILGGAGGLGRIFASEIVARVPTACVVVAGRSHPVPPLPDRVAYRQLDLAHAADVEALVRGIAAEFGRLDGILHCAGVLRDSLAVRKNSEELRAVLAPKVHGSVNLARAIATLEKVPDFLVLFSSTSGVLGNAGQFDYSAANGFQDALANVCRTAATRVLAIDWPLWRDGGMRVDTATEAVLREKWGACPLETASGLQAFYRAWQTSEAQVLVWNGTPGKIAELPGKQTWTKLADPASFNEGGGNLGQRLKGVLAEVTGVTAAEIDEARAFDAYGIDSILMTELNRKLGAIFPDMSRMLLYEHDTVGSLAQFLETHYPGECARLMGAPAVVSAAIDPVELAPNDSGVEAERGRALNQGEPIAIVGLSVRFPGAETLSAFWRLLEAGAVSVTEGPPGRWPLPATDAASEKQRTVKWGGFLQEPYAFDPLFFGMTPREAEETDPQERLFLEECWKALEDAGYSVTDLPPEVRRGAAVFGAITKQGYNLTGSADRMPATSFASLANRVSYHFDLQGPSLPIDTMCSSALVAVHYACQYLRQGGELAIVGGANLYLHPSTFAKLEANQLASGTECSDPFGCRGDGFVPGEGIGALVLKPLGKAERDGDAVYAVIRGTAVNHGGKSANYTAPSARQQAAVIRDALADAGVGLETIGYIETAANGSQAGDAAEAAAISKAFGQRVASDANRYWMGSVKPNIGHPEAASGIAQIAKVSLALRHGRLPPTVLSAGFEPCVPLEHLPFELVRRGERWAPLIVAGRPCPRRAGIMGVGAGGVNAHVIIEEYIPVLSIAPERPSSVGPVVLTVSARTPDALQAYAAAWLDYLEAHPDADLFQLAYVAQVGRSGMSCRRAIVAAELEDLKRHLRDTAVASTPPAFSRPAPVEAIKRALAQRDWGSLARLWEQGADVPWASLYAAQVVRRLHGLPVYPFARRDCSPVFPTGSSIPTKRTNTPNGGTTANRAIEFYSVWAQNSASEAREDFLTFCPFETRVPGFSMSRAFLFPEKYPQEWALMKAKQIELRQVLFYEEDFARLDAVFDIGCGFGTDLVGIARAYPKLRADGFSLTADQVKVANARIVQAGLQDRVRVWQRDSAESAYPGRYDLMMGIEVTFHIREKDRLFGNMVAGLRLGGRILLMDFITNLSGAIVDPNLEISIPTKLEWIELLSRHGLVLTSVIDVSPQIANFLHDPDYREITRDLPELVQQTFQNYANQSRSLEQGWVAYCLLKIQKVDDGDSEELCRRNRDALDKPIPYPVALAAMRAGGPAPYPRAESSSVAEIAPLLTVPSMPVSGVKDELLALCSKELGFVRAELSERATFRDLAVGSVEATRLTQAVNERFDLHLPTSVILECRTVGDFATAIAARAQQNGRPPGPRLSTGEPVIVSEAVRDTVATARPASPRSDSDPEAIAVIGLSLRCAGANSAETFWDLIREGRDAADAVEDPHWLEVLRREVSPQAEYRRGMITDRDGFDAAFFNLSPREAASMDVSHRLILEETYKALEDAGYASDRLNRMKTGTFVGASGPDSAVEATSHFSLLGTDASVMASRIAYYLDLRGPALAVNAACASSLAAIDLAIQKLRGNEIDLAIGGGVAVFDSPLTMVRLHKGGLLSPTALCRPFDAAANGFVLGDGVGVVILKRLTDAERHGDHIYGVIRGIGCNQNGQTLGFTVPSASAQSDLFNDLYARCGLAAKDIQYVETNGTATKLGDLVELAALAQVHGRHAPQKQHCVLGALKGNIGNCGAASGVLALIKVLLGLKHRTLPPIAGFLRPNPEFDLANSPFRVEPTAIDWPASARGPRRAALSSFGFNGTNYHLVVEEYPTAESPSRRPALYPDMLLLSAQSRVQLIDLAGAIGTYLERHNDIPLADILYTLRTGRQSHAVRLAIITADREHLVRDLQNVAQGADVDEDRVYITRSNASVPCLDDTPEGADFLAQLAANRRLNKLAELWVNGAAIDWARLFIDEGARRIAGLPSYPFARAAAASTAPPSVADIPNQVVSSLAQALKTTLAQCLSLPAERLPNDASFQSLGLDSIVAAEWIAELNHRHGIVVGLQSLYECSSIRKLANCLEGQGVRPRLAEPAPTRPLVSREDASSPPALPAVSAMVSCEVRRVSLADLETWSRLERALLPETLATPITTLRERIENNPGGNFLVEPNGRTIGYVSLQRVRSMEDLRRVTFDGLPSVLGDAAGEVLLLIALELLPDRSNVGLRAEVLAWVLRLGESMSGVKSVVHFARCIGFSGRNEAEFAKYLLEANRGGFATEPVLRDHRQLGGTVRGLLANYRPADRANLGMGVWVQHDLRHFGSETAPLASPNGQKDLPAAAPSLSRLMKCLPEIVPLAMQGDGSTTFWIHPMSGEVGVYHKLARQIRGEFKMIGLQARGFLRPEHKPLDSMPTMARHYADIIKMTQAVGPYHLAGFSFGGTIAYEVVRELQARGDHVASLLMIEAPFVSDDVAALTTMSRRSALVMNANFLVLALLTIDSTVAAALRSGASDWTRYRVTEESVADVGDDDLPDFLATHCRHCGVTQATEIIKQKLVTMTDVHLANLCAVQTYRTTALERPKEIKCALLRTREAVATSKLVLNPPYLESIQRRYNSMSAVLEGWKSMLPHAEAVVLEGANHLELFHDEQCVKVVRQAVCEFYRLWSEVHPFKPNGTSLPPARPERAVLIAPGQAEGRGKPEPGIAVIGMSGRFPEASDVEAFWQNLANGRSSVKEVPTDRGWNIDDYYDPKPQRPAKTYCRRGAFLEHVDCFDPLFFGISPLEAELMDPSERLFLQEGWRAIEHAGYAPGQLKRRKWGVFACVKGDYPSLVQRYYPTFLAATDSLPPARLSYTLDLIGPAVSVDTACSSALAAIAHACDSLSLGSCDAAVVGAGGVYVTPNMLVSSSQSLLFSPDGECYTFDERANGTVLGEAVGVVVLKRLTDALADGDPILGVIRGWGTNQNGRTNGLTAPSALSQAALQTEVYRRHGIDPGRITLVEAHGTGTKLGDPVEYQALRESFARHTTRERYCALGSLKTNIGHPFAAAGIAGLIKVLLAFQHRQIPPSLNFRRLNPLIDEAGSPFFVNTALREWESPVDQPRLAAINSFGATGINVHLVVEEYRAKSALCVPSGPEPPVVIVLSAKDRSRLEDGCRGLLDWIRRRRIGLPDLRPDLRDLAYTLQVARDPMEARLAFVTKSIDDLESRLASVIEASAAPNALYYAEVKLGRTALKAVSPLELQAAADEQPEAALDRVAHAWVHGASVDWDALSRETKPRRINLPGYVFARDRYWVGSTPKTAGSAPSVLPGQERLHPLLHRNTSTLGRTRYSSFFSGTEFFLIDHVVNGERILPGVVYLELAREAVVRAMPGWSAGGPDSVLCIKNVVWLRPFVVGTGGREIHLELETPRDGEIAFEIYSSEAEDPARRVVHSQGHVELRSGAATMKAANLELLQARCNRATLTAESCYAAFRENQVDYGPSHRGVVRIHIGGIRSTDAEILAQLELPAVVRQGSEGFALHPSLLDSALQAALGFAYVEAPAERRKQLSLPFALDELEIHGHCKPETWAHLRRAQTADGGESIEKLDIDLYDGAGRGLIRLRGFSSKVLGNFASEAEKTSRPATLMFVPVWSPAAARKAGAPPLARWVIAVNPGGQGALPGRSAEDGVDVCCIELRDGVASEQYAQLAVELFARIRTRLRADPDQRLLMQVVLPGGAHRRLLSAVSALVRTAEQECPRILGQVIEFSGEGWPPDIFERLDRWSVSAEDKQVRDEGAASRVLHWERLLPPEAAPEKVWRAGGVYLITGGAGGLGWIFAREIVERVQRPVVILAGRSLPETLDATKLDKLRGLGTIVSYEEVDVTQRAEVDRMIGRIIAQHGALHGVLHAAGVVRDRLILNKTNEEFAAVLASKVAGTANLDEATRNLPLELFVLFSSGAGVLGNPGQADYAAANAFMDRFAEVRSEQVVTGERRGRTLSINWPLWEDGGMKVSPEAVASMARSLGIVPLRTASGLHAFYSAYASTASQVMLVEGDPARIVLPAGPSQAVSSVEDAASLLEASRSPAGADSWRDQAVSYFQSLLASMLKLPVHRVDPTESFEKYGIDSIIATGLVNQLEETYGSLPKTLFFEYQNVEVLADYFLTKYRDRTAELIGVTPGSVAIALPPPSMPTVASAASQPAVALPASTDIAIIGLAGRFPGARTVAEFWENLRAGKDCVTEVPPERWDLASYFTPDKSQLGKSYSKWGGFIDGVDLFDPLFFNLAPQTAALIDPKERLFLETVWELFESVGLTRDAIEHRHAGAVGVFVGAMYQDYHAFDSTWVNEAIVSLSSYSSVANRVSHFFNFRGPSVAIDTMCSSTLSAIKMACDSLMRDECELAVAGGVNLSLHPKKYVGLSLGRMIGSHPDSRGFADGDGYIPAETVGAFLLKPLASAVWDGDRIIAVIKAVHLNHDGRSNGYAIPNPVAQAKLIQENFRRSGIHPRTIGYVEAAANGSALGDPIEVAALKTAFRAFTEDTNYCAIGTVKSNIGHAEAASGVGQLAKVVLQLQHGELVPSIKAERLNPNLSFVDSPFYLQRQAGGWLRQREEEQGHEIELPRRACVSSFGAGGSNAHLILEEYLRADASALNVPEEAALQVLVFSARTAERLRVHVERILLFLDHADQVSLRDLGYTLQCGREAMDCRLAFVASGLDVVRSTLRGWLETGAASAGAQPQRLYTGDRNADSPWNGLASGRAGSAWVQSLLAERDLEKLALLWANGASVPWHNFYPGRRPEIVALPTYPFERRRCRLEPAAPASAVDQCETAQAVVDEAAPDWHTLLAGMLGIDPDEIDLDTPLEQYGLDSILRTQFAQRVQAQVDAKLSMGELRSCRNLRELLALLPHAPAVRTAAPHSRAASAPAAFRELVRLGNGIEPPVFWFHAGVGGVEAYEVIAAHSQRTFYGIQARGWMNDDPPLQGIAALTDYYAHIVQAIQSTGPYDLGGYSMGGALAYEVTRRLQQAGHSVRSMVMLDTLDGEGVGHARNSSSALYLQVVNTLLASTVAPAGDGLTRHLIRRDQIVGEMTESAFLDRLVDLARERGLAKPELQLRSTIEQMAAVQRAYEYENFKITPLPCPREVEAYYVRNANGVFLGPLEPYFTLEPAVLDRSDHWQDWQAQLPRFHRVDVSSMSHMTLLMEKEPLTAILELCGMLYGRKTLE